jgi:hypothetical protein
MTFASEIRAAAMEYDGKWRDDWNEAWDAALAWERKNRK